MEEITKRVAAKRQLETAIKLFFENRDLLSAYTLASAAKELMEGIYQNEKKRIMAEQWNSQTDKPEKERVFYFSVKENLEIAIKNEHKKEAWQIFNRVQNFLKHADKDPEEILAFKGIDELEYVLFSACWNYSLLFKERSEAVVLMNIWMLTRHPNIIKKEFLSDDKLSVLRERLDVIISSKGISNALSYLYDILKLMSADLFKKSDAQKFETFDCDRSFIEENFSHILNLPRKQA